MTTIDDKEELCGLEVWYLPFHPGTVATNSLQNGADIAEVHYKALQKHSCHQGQGRGSVRACSQPRSPLNGSSRPRRRARHRDTPGLNWSEGAHDEPPKPPEQ
jgi:hypothetical protein